MTPRVSVVMPAHNAAATVGAAVSSVLGQSYREFELVLLDDGSTDATTAIAAAHEGPVRVVRQANAGVAAARNRGIAEASGDLVAFCDADDLWFEEHLAALVRTYDSVGGKRIATANSYWLFPAGIDSSKVRYRGRFPSADRQRVAILEQNFVSTMSLFPRTLVDEIGPFDIARRRAEDWDFWLRAIYAGYHVVLQRQPLALYRWSASGLSADYAQMDEEVVAILRAVSERGDLRDDERRYLARRLAGPEPREVSRLADAALRSGDYREAAVLLRRAASLVPSERPLVWKARAISLAPAVIGRLVRARQRGVEQSVGLDEQRRR